MTRHPVALRVIVGVYLVLLGAITLTPQPDDARDGFLHRIAELLAAFPLTASLPIAALEFVANVVLFIPCGLLGVLLFGRGRWWVSLAVGIALTGAIELAQFGIPNRVPDPRDLIANTLGCGVGIALALLLARLPPRAAVR